MRAEADEVKKLIDERDKILRSEHKHKGATSQKGRRARLGHLGATRHPAGPVARDLRCPAHDRARVPARRQDLDADARRVLVVLAPVQGTVAAPLALHLNRVR
jgi:hypothetical protein